MTTYQYQGKRGEFIVGIPARDLTERDVARLSEGQLEQMEATGLYVADDRKDPLGELTDADYDALTPAEKGARTRKANELKREGEGANGDPPEDEGDDNDEDPAPED